MKSLLFVCSLVLALVALSEAATPTIPLFVWSNNKIFSRQGDQFLNTITENDIENALNSLLGSKTESFISEVQTNPEAVVLFVEPQLQTDQISHFGAAYANSPNGGAFSGLKGLLENSGSSIVAPYATTGNALSLLDSLLSRLADKHSILLVREQGSTMFEEIKHLNVRSITMDTFSGGDNKADLIVVCFNKAADADHLAAHDMTIKAISDKISATTSGNYVGMYTGNTAPFSHTLWTFPNPNAALFEQPQAYSPYGVEDPSIIGNYTQRTYFTGPIIETFMVVAALLTMVFVGVCNICALQVPETYETPKQQKQQM